MIFCDRVGGLGKNNFFRVWGGGQAKKGFFYDKGVEGWTAEFSLDSEFLGFLKILSFSGFTIRFLSEF